MLNFLIGEPSKANGFDLPKTINDALIEAVTKETNNGYTMASGTLEARKAIVKKYF
jgi:aspartate/methionine/tyrosine aminotransferase